MRNPLLATGCLLVAFSSYAIEYGVGVETTRYKVELVRTDQTDTNEFTMHDDWTQVAALFDFGNGLSLKIGTGVSGALLEEIDPSDGSREERGGTGGFIFSAKFLFEKTFGNSTILLTGAGYSASSVDWDDSDTDYEYDNSRFELLASIGFIKSGAAVPYAGLSFIWYDVDLVRDGSVQQEFENSDAVSFVLGVRTRGAGLAAGAELSFGAETRFSLTLTVPF